MRGNSEKRRRKIAPMVCAVVILGVLGVLLGLVVLPLLGLGRGDSTAVVILALYALALLAVMIGVIAATLQRLREIDVNTLTPIEALQTLYELCKAAEAY